MEVGRDAQPAGEAGAKHVGVFVSDAAQDAQRAGGHLPACRA
jgi:hypothetical protein